MMDQPKLSPRGNDPVEVERLTSAIYQVQVDSARSRVAEIKFDLSEMRRVAETVALESDRAAAILLFSYAEDMMLQGIKRNINDGIKGGMKGLTAQNGLLATAADRITFLGVLQWIDKSTYTALNALRSIRNRFAHHVACDSLSDRSISTMIAALPDFERPIIEQVPIEPFGYRQTFLARAFLTVYRVMHETSVYPHALAHHVHPRDVSGGFDDGLANLRQLGLTAADCILLLKPRRVQGVEES